MKLPCLKMTLVLYRSPKAPSVHSPKPLPIVELPRTFVANPVFSPATWPVPAAVCGVLTPPGWPAANAVELPVLPKLFCVPASPLPLEPKVPPEQVLSPKGKLLLSPARFWPGDHMRLNWTGPSCGDSYQMACGARTSNSTRLSPPVLEKIEL